MTTNPWSTSEEKKLSDFIRNKDPYPVIFAAFPDRSQASVRRKVSILREQDPSLPQATITKVSWDAAAEAKLRCFIRDSAPYETIYAAFPLRSQASIRKKVRDLRALEPALPQASQTRTPWTSEELGIVNSGIEKGLTTLQISEMLPDRTLIAVQAKTASLFQASRSCPADLTSLNTQGFQFVSWDNWPGLRRSSSINSLLVVVFASFFLNIQVATLTLRSWILEAESSNKTTIVFYIINSIEDLRI
jgi:hypothetical protein